MKPKRSILDKAFVYRNSASSDIRLTFARVRREQRAAEKAKAEAPAVVTPIKRSRGGAS